MYMKRRNIILSFALLPLAVAAQTTFRVPFASVALASGDSVVTRLYNDSVTVKPMINPTSRTLSINGVAYSFDEIEGIRFDVRSVEVSAIDKVRATAKEAVGVYTLDGKLVRREATSTEGLDKGVYIMNKKKIVVK